MRRDDAVEHKDIDLQLSIKHGNRGGASKGYVGRTIKDSATPPVWINQNSLYLMSRRAPPIHMQFRYDLLRIRVGAITCTPQGHRLTGRIGARMIETTNAILREGERMPPLERSGRFRGQAHSAMEAEKLGLRA